MRSTRYGSRQCLVVLCTSFLLLLLTGCGGKAPSSAPAPDTAGPGISASIDLSRALSELDALVPPAGIDPALFGKLKSSLRAMLLQRASGKAASTPPATAQSKVDDLRAVRYGSGATFTFTYRNAGDYSQDGMVNTADLLYLALYFGQDSSAPDWNKAQMADGDGNGHVELGDLSPLGANFGKRVAGYHLSYSADGAADWLQIADLAWSASAVPAEGGRRSFTQRLAQPSAGYYRVTPYDSTSEGVVSDVYHFAASGLAVGGWPMFGGDAQHTRQSQYTGPLSEPHVWSNDASSGAPSFTDATFGTDGTAYFGRQNELVALSSSGELKWHVATTEYIHEPPVTGPDGTVYVSSDYLYAINPEGTLKWRSTGLGDYSGPATGHDGTIYVTRDNIALALNPDGSVRWAYPTPADVPAADAPSPPKGPGSPPPPPPPPPPPLTSRNSLATPVVGPDSTAYVMGYDGSLYAIGTDGALRWSYADAGHSTVAGQDGAVYTCSTDHKLLALNPDGSMKWQAAADIFAYAIAIGPDGLLYISSGYYLIALNLDGTIKWFHATGRTITRPVFDAAGTVFVMAEGNLDALQDSGTQYPNLLWRYPLAADWDGQTNPARGLDGTLWLNGSADRIYGLNPDGTLLWNSTVQWRSSSPAVAANKLAYGGSAYGVLRGYEASSWELWGADPRATSSSPALNAQGTLYIGAENGRLYALDATDPISSVAVVDWSFTAGAAIESSPAVGSDGTVFVGCNDDKLYALNPDGTLKWSYATQGAVVSSPALGLDGTVYAGSRDHKLYAIDADGALRWSYDAGVEIDSSPAIGIDGTVFFTSNDNLLHALSPAGAELWSYPADGGANPGLSNAGTIYCSGGGGFSALNPDGTLKWSYATGSAALPASPVIGADGSVFIAGGDNTFYALTDEGVLLWRYQLDVAITSSPVIGQNGYIYVGCSDGEQYVFSD